MNLKQIDIITRKIYGKRQTDELEKSIKMLSKYHGVVEIPKGFQTDFATSPRLFWSLVPKRGLYDLATLVHDYLYRVQKLSRLKADLEEWHIMTGLKVPFWQKCLISAGSILFGWFYWSKFRK